MNRTVTASVSLAALLLLGCTPAPALAQARPGGNSLAQGGPPPFSFAPLVRRVMDYWLAGVYPSEADIAALQRGAATAPIGTPRRVADVVPAQPGAAAAP